MKRRTNHFNSANASSKGTAYQRHQHIMSEINHKMGQKVPGLHYYTSAQTSAQMAKNAKHTYYSSTNNQPQSSASPASYADTPTNDLNNPTNPNSPDNPNNPNNYQNISRKHRHHKWELIIAGVTCLATIAGVGLSWWNNNNNKPANHTEKVYPTKQTKTTTKPTPKPRVKVKKIYEKPRVQKIIKREPAKPSSSASARTSSSASQPSSVAPSSSSVASMKSRASNIGNDVKNKAIQFGHRLRGYEQKPSSSSDNQ